MSPLKKVGQAKKVPAKKKRAAAKRSRDRSRIVLLGPQSRVVTAGEVAADLWPEGTIATVTAGWQEREPEDEELNSVFGGRTDNLRLYGRAEAASAADPELGKAHRSLQESLKLLRRAYNLRLSKLMDTWTALTEMRGDPAVLDPERAAALETVRRLDISHIARITEMRAEFFGRWRPGERDAIVEPRREIEKQLADASAVAIAGGHIAVLLNRLRIFGLDEMLANMPVIAWSAGAMALADTVVLFHDHPPQGPGHAEAFDHGLGFYSDLVPLPDGSRRLALADAARTGRLARRFAPALCVLLDDGSLIERTKGKWEAGETTRRITHDGRAVEVAA